MSQLSVTLVGWGAIAQSIHARLKSQTKIRVTHIVVRDVRVSEVQAHVDSGITVCADVPAHAQLVLECAGHDALSQHVVPALERGIECAVLSVGALSQLGLPERLEAAALAGQTQVHLLAGAIGGIDAIAAAKMAGLTQVTYTGRKPPLSWQGTPAEQQFDLTALKEPTVILQATAREAAHLYPKNANVAATISLAGLGLDQTQVRLIADPTVTENIHEVQAVGAFGSMQLRMQGKPLSDNPKTSALTVLSALRFLQNRVAALTV